MLVSVATARVFPRLQTPYLGRLDEDGDKEEEAIGDAQMIAKVFGACH